MPVFWHRHSGPSALPAYSAARRRQRAAIEPMLPAMMRGVAFICALAAPFVAVLLLC